LNEKNESTKPGPKPDTVKIEGDWKDAIKKALGKKPEPKEPDDDGEVEDPAHHCGHCGSLLLQENHSCPSCGRILPNR